MRRDVVLLAEKTLGATPEQAIIRWKFLLGVGGDGLRLSDIPALARQFADRLDDPAMRKALEEFFRRERRLDPGAAIEAAGEFIENFKNMLRRGEILEGVG